MPTHADLASRLLTDAAGFFRTLASQNPGIQKEMSDNADVFDQISTLITQDPQGVINDQTHAELAGRLLKDAADFFRTLASQNEPIQEQMNENANVFEQVASLVAQDPLGILE